MNAPQDLNRLYSDVSDNIASAMADILELNVEHKDGKREVGNMTEKLRAIQVRFDGELDQLKTHAEWDMFTMAFFGETNAGKSTIIESLRILFKEESRQALLEHNAHDLVKYEKALAEHIDQLRESLNAVYQEYATQITDIRQGVRRLSEILQDEAMARNRLVQAQAQARTALAEQEANARLKAEQEEAAQRLAAEQAIATQRLKIEQEEAAQRLQLAQDQSNANIRTKLIAFASGGLVLGAGASALLLKLAGA
ncbi:hypothetical protein [Pseudomonas gessardii]|jgi:energy-coupling factor transporter ATP-binding protein EcfA2|uniref:hypothetical protein n=1 Tax=Pseudomonas gessardii TaxID=78544 RepID=UPI0008857ECE|nr:hypothetical protein [Pseudomonas gessardii]MBH3424861.1 hypothetical protein [Pseudomonas gessardii]MRU54219.1 hypothetical protein [Pseudomonas gessardii]ONH36291.1 hypothetical protein BLL38_27740 [Pseudomonas gessardii]SDQ43314.1 hypothetical protein SAMN04490207_0455 [Pseudomonas gessardii]